MPIGDFYNTWSTDKIEDYQGQLYHTAEAQYTIGTTDNTFEFEVPMKKVQSPILMEQIPWPAELLVTREQVIAALDGSTVVQCPDCDKTTILPPVAEVAHCTDHWKEVPVDPFYDQWNTTYGGIAQGTNVHWQQDFTDNTQTSDFTQRIMGEWRTK